MENKHLYKRIVFLDLIKTIAIYFVCVYHFNDLSINFIKQSSFSTYFVYFILGIASTGVPLFFMVNGALLLNKPLNLKKHCFKTLNLVLLTILWGIITLLLLVPIQGNNYSIVDFIKALWTWEKGTIDYLWYLHTLICIYILFPLIKVVYDQKDKSILKYTVVIIFILTFGNVLFNMGANVVESILGNNYITGDGVNFFNEFNVFKGFYGYTLVYFIVGAIIFEKLKSTIQMHYQQLAFMLLFGMLVLCGYGIMMSFSNGELFDTVWFGYDTVMTLFMALAIFFLAYLISPRLGKLSKFIQMIGDNTLGIYFLHISIGFFLQPYYELLPFSTNLGANLIFGVIILLLSLSVTLILKKIPFVKGLFICSLDRELNYCFNQWKRLMTSMKKIFAIKYN